MATELESPKPKPPFWVRFTMQLAAQVGFQISARLVRDRYGLGLGYAMLVGLAACVLAMGVAHLVLVLAPRRWRAWQGELPTCLHGNCRGQDGYEVVDQLLDGAVVVCGCGIQYQHRPRIFEVRHADGTTSPFMRRWWLGRWRLVGERRAEVVSPYRY